MPRVLTTAEWTAIKRGLAQRIRALNAFVRGLGDEDRVWVTLFESAYQDFAEAPLLAREARKDPAFAGLENLKTGGGTELFPALQHVLKQITLLQEQRAFVVIGQAQRRDRLPAQRPVALERRGQLSPQHAGRSDDQDPHRLTR